MHHGNYENWEITQCWRNGTTKSKKNLNTRRKGNVQILGNIINRHHQTRGDERKKLKKSISGKRESYSKPNYLTGTFVKYSWSGPEKKFNKWLREENQWWCIRLYIPRYDIDRLYVSRKEVGRGLAIIEDSIYASIQQLEDYIAMLGGRLITAIRNNTNNTWINRMKITRKNKNERKNSCMDIMSDKQVISHMRKFGCD